MQKSVVSTGFLEADPHMMFCEDGFYEQYVKERVDFYSSEGWQLLDSKRPNPPRPHMWLNLERIVTASPPGIVYREVDDDEFGKHWNLSDQEGHRAGTEQA